MAFIRDPPIEELEIKLDMKKGLYRIFPGRVAKAFQVYIANLMEWEGIIREGNSIYSFGEYKISIELSRTGILHIEGRGGFRGDKNGTGKERLEDAVKIASRTISKRGIFGLYTLPGFDYPNQNWNPEAEWRKEHLALPKRLQLSREQ